GAAESQARPDSTSQGDQAAPGHSSTTVHEQGVDEPDLVKTDGRRIVTVVDGTLRVVDAASRALTGSLPLPGGADDLLLSGDKALLLRRGAHGMAVDLPMPVPMPDPAPPGTATPDPGPPPGRPTQDPAEPVEPTAPPAEKPAEKPAEPAEPGVAEPGLAAPDHSLPPFDPRAELLLVGLSGTPTVLGRFAIDGRLVDARLVGTTVRAVTHSMPQLRFTHPTAAGRKGIEEATARNTKIVEDSDVSQWLPGYSVTAGGTTSDGRVDCAAVTHPASYSATSMLTVLTFDLGADTLGTGSPVTIVADGDVVYGTADSLYVASDAGRAAVLRGGPAGPVPGQDQQRTEIYKFDTSGSGAPRHVASGAVPGSLLNQYSLSEYDGHLRVATTSLVGQTTESAVYALRQDGDRLATVGQVGGLGRDERIYAVRFIGPLGYVVTFRQTDPLYTVDLRDPAKPVVAGELKISGYSAHLLPVGDGRLIGIGQEADADGRVLGTQVSLFDVSDPARPGQLARYHVKDSSSEAEHDPHALLWWPETAQLVLPIVTHDGQSRATVLDVGEAALTEAGQLRPGQAYDSVRRSLVIGDTLWTLTGTGLTAHALDTLAPRGSVTFGS
ncbi:MAG TPA: beta-propeller domain-containing protein, partial [Pseudonocardiaceae bacterium]